MLPLRSLVPARNRRTRGASRNRIVERWLDLQPDLFWCLRTPRGVLASPTTSTPRSSRRGRVGARGPQPRAGRGGGAPRPRRRRVAGQEPRVLVLAPGGWPAQRGGYLVAVGGVHVAPAQGGHLAAPHRDSRCSSMIRRTVITYASLPERLLAAPEQPVDQVGDGGGERRSPDGRRRESCTASADRAAVEDPDVMYCRSGSVSEIPSLDGPSANGSHLPVKSMAGSLLSAISAVPTVRAACHPRDRSEAEEARSVLTRRPHGGSAPAPRSSSSRVEQSASRRLRM